jgi:hypothetical protein
LGAQPEPTSSRARNFVLEQVKTLGHLELVVAKAGASATTIEAHAALHLGRLTTLFGETLPEHANTARNDLDEARSVALAALTMTTGQVKDLIARVNTMSTCPELDAARKFADDRTKEASKKDVAPFNRLLVNFKKMLTHCERERKLAGSAAEDTTAAAPLYAILKAIADDGDVNADGSLFDAQPHGLGNLHELAAQSHDNCPGPLGLPRLGQGLGHGADIRDRDQFCSLCRRLAFGGWRWERFLFVFLRMRFASIALHPKVKMLVGQ